MFDFCKLDVYQKAKAFCILITKIITSGNFDRTTNDQLRRASLSIMLNIAEGSSRFSNKDRKNFMVVARGSAFHCAAILPLSVARKCVTPPCRIPDLQNKFFSKGATAIA